MSYGTATPLAAGASYTGQSVFNTEPDVMVTCKTDAAGTLFIEFSIDGSNWDTSVARQVDANVGEFVVLRKGARFCRVRYVNGAAPQTFLRLGVSYGAFGQATSGLTATIQPDADAITARVIGEESFTAEGRYTGRSIVNKFGRNPALASASTPEDLWNGSTVYAGFPTGNPEEFTVTLANIADAGGTLNWQYLASPTATEYTTATFVPTATLAAQNTGITGWRAHTANISFASGTQLTAGEITIAHRTTTSNVFIRMSAGRSQSYVGAYTVPAGSTGYLRKLGVQMQGTGTITGGLWVRERNKSPRIRRPFTVTSAAPFEDIPYGGLELPALTDITVRFLTAPVTAVEAFGQMDIIVVKD